MTHPIQDRWRAITQSIATHHPHVTVMAVTKAMDVHQMVALLEAGARVIGENRVQPAMAKFQSPPLCDWMPRVQKHLIGPLQRNKIGKALGVFDCIHAIDRLSILDALSTHQPEQSGPIMGFLQVNTGNEDQKSGFTYQELTTHHHRLFSFPNIKINGIIAVTPYHDNPELSRPYFRETCRVWQFLSSIYPDCRELSMGMSHDYNVAIEEGATMVRLGSVLVESCTQ